MNIMNQPNEIIIKDNLRLRKYDGNYEMFLAPYRDPYIAIYPIARIEGKTIVQLQQGHIIDYNRWWRV